VQIFQPIFKGSYFTHRKHDLKIFDPDGNQMMPAATDISDRFFANKGVFPYLQGYISKEQKSNFKVRTKTINLDKHKKQTVYQSKDYSLSAIPVHHGPIPALAKGSDLLVAHNAIPEFQKGAGRKLHMPPSEIGKIARQAIVKKLILSLRRNRTLGREKETIRLVRKNYHAPILFADDLDIFIPIKP